MLLALMSMMALAVFAPAAMADAVVGDGDDYDSDTAAATAAAAQYGDNGVYGDQYGDDHNDDGIDDDNGAALPSTGGPALLPLVGLAALGIGALSLVSARVRRNS